MCIWIILNFIFSTELTWNYIEKFQNNLFIIKGNYFVMYILKIINFIYFTIIILSPYFLQF